MSHNWNLKWPSNSFSFSIKSDFHGKNKCKETIFGGAKGEGPLGGGVELEVRDMTFCKRGDLVKSPDTVHNL